MNKTILIVLVIFLTLTFATFVSANNTDKKTADVKCRCNARATLKCGLGKSDEANKCRQKHIQSCHVKCSLFKKCASKVAEECSSKKVGSVEYKKCQRLTVAQHCLSEIDKSLIKDCKCKTFSRSICGSGSSKESVRCRDVALEECQKQCEKPSCINKRICITESKCSCKRISKDKCSSSDNVDECYAEELKTCQSRCQKSTRCFPMSCKNAGYKRCDKAVEAICSKTCEKNKETFEECVSKKTLRCRSFEKATCKKALRLNKYRESCTARAEKKCSIFSSKEKCECTRNARKRCVEEKITHRKIYVRNQKSCAKVARSICDVKKHENVEKCYKDETKRCHRRNKRRHDIVPPTCIDLVHKKCGNTEGQCFKKNIKKCTTKWLRRYCEHKAFKSCDGHFECMEDEIIKCKSSLPKCWGNRCLCKDNNKCTSDICHPKLGCVNKQKSCNDNKACTIDSCVPTLGCVHTQKDCDDKVDCTEDSCNPENGQCEHNRAHSKCKTIEKCKSGVCTAKGCKFHFDETCTKRNCEDTCSGKCVAKNKCETVQCECDKNFEAKCIPTYKSCDDGKKCTVDFCDHETGNCIHKKRTDIPECNSPSCDSEKDCTSWEVTRKLHKQCKYAVCEDSVCVEKSLKDCIIPRECEEKCKTKSSTCNAGIHKCKRDDKGDVVCDNNANSCDDGIKCTRDYCDEKNGKCVHEKIVDTEECKRHCSSSLDCAAWAITAKLSDTCQEAYCNKTLGACQSRDIEDKVSCECEKSCVAKNKCENAKYVVKGGKCTCHRTAVSCDDNDYCTKDSCDNTIGCVHKSGDCRKCKVKCEKSTSKCFQTRCVKDKTTGKHNCEKTKLDCNDNDDSTDDVCDDTLGCTHICRDKSKCNCNCAEKKCQVSKCVKDKSGVRCLYEPKSCSDNDKCTTDFCDILTGSCVHANKGICPIKCDKDCTTSNKCSKCVKVGDQEWKCDSNFVQCDDHDACTFDSCDAKVGCVHTLIKDKPECKVCKSNSDCVDLNHSLKLHKSCKKAFCDKKAGHCQVIDRKNKSKCQCQCLGCTPSNACDSAECVCEKGVGVCKHVQKSCDDNNICTTDYCDLKSGKCVNARVNGNCCNNNAECSQLDKKLAKFCKKAGVCEANKCKITEDKSRKCDICTSDENCGKLNESVSSQCKKAVCNKLTGKCDITKDTSKTCCKGCTSTACEIAECKSVNGNSVCERRPKCNDNNECTKDSCSQSGQCVFTKIVSDKCFSCEKKVDCTKWALSTNTTGDCYSCDTARNVCVVHSDCKPICAECKSSRCETAKCQLLNGKASCLRSKIVCDDFNLCTRDYCDPDVGCVYKQIKNCCPPINNLNKCQITKCTTNGTSVSTTKACTDNDSCTIDYCDIRTGECRHEAKNTKDCVKRCNVKCNFCDSCVSKGENDWQCVTSNINKCDDNNKCTNDICDSVNGKCVHTFIKDCIKCDHDLDCKQFGKNSKLPTKCQNKKPVCDKNTNTCVLVEKDVKSKCCECKNCEPNNACETTECICPLEGEPICKRIVNNCDDFNPCTKDYCDTKNGNCLHFNIKNANCTKCDKDCEILNSKVSKSCFKAFCDKSSNKCKVVKDESRKDCTGCINCNAGVCETAVCQINESGQSTCVKGKKSCDDGNRCTLDTCDSKTGSCVNTPISGCCSKRVDCNSWAKSQNIDSCHEYLCDKEIGTCKIVPTSNPSLLQKCSKCNLKCTSSNLCEISTCAFVNGTYTCVNQPVNCDDGIDCTVDSCNFNTGKCVHNATNCNTCKIDSDCASKAKKCQTGRCDISTLTCVFEDSINSDCICIDCVSSTCVHASCVSDENGNPTCIKNTVTCPDSNPCTKDYCDLQTGNCVHLFQPNDLCVTCDTKLDCAAWSLSKNLSSHCQDAICDQNLKICTTVELADKSKCCTDCVSTPCMIAECIQGDSLYCQKKTKELR